MRLTARRVACVCVAGQEGKAKHAKAKHETSYKEMAIYALQQVGGRMCVGKVEGLRQADRWWWWW